MGVSIGYRIARKDGGLSAIKSLDIGARSLAYQLLSDNNLLGGLDRSDVATLREVAKKQMLGQRNGSLEFDPSITLAFRKLASDIKKHGSVLVEAAW